MGVLESILSATMEEDDLGPNIDDTLRAIRQGKVTDEEVNKLLAVFQTQGVVSSVGGGTRLRKISDIRNTLERANRSFDVAIENAQNAEAPQISDTNRKLMEDILRRSSENHSEMSSRVTALLAGSALTTKAGVRIERRDTVEQVDYTAVGDDLEPLKQTKYAPRRRKAQSEWQGPVSIHQANWTTWPRGQASKFNAEASNACPWPDYERLQNSPAFASPAKGSPHRMATASWRMDWMTLRSIAKSRD